jgi:hypothetical protein
MRIIHDKSAVIKSKMEEIYRLSEQQVQALKGASFVGMTNEETTECDSRRLRIRSLVAEVEHLQDSGTQGKRRAG